MELFNSVKLISFVTNMSQESYELMIITQASSLMDNR